ncbi:zinc finger protein [Culex quinquefasciatus]|uniref:Zinc finger protein n=1 Tax=Culex quinquefasciatus TaxID=7176 RepID=B0WBW8_CULQU|nr:zinc finger protein [Culex quinquefasciatus]|eukprot:XP_001846202.1 zinc finger protein [Culex quinquefasciatus]
MNNPHEFVLYSYALPNQLYQIKPDVVQPVSAAGINPANIVHIIPAARNVSLHHSPTIRIVENIQIQQPLQLVCGQPAEPVIETVERESNNSTPVIVEEVPPQTIAQSEDVRAKSPEVLESESVERPLVPLKPPSKAKKNFIYECDICESRFLSANSLRLHKTGHRYKRDQEKKAFSCRFCGRQFSHQQTLGDHEKVHIDDRYNCAACGARYNSKSGLRNHLSKNADCDASFQERKIAHRKREEDGKRWGCDVCGKKYRHRKSMVEHRSLHYKQNRCERCGAMFETIGGWRKHTALKRCEFSKSRFRDPGKVEGSGSAEGNVRRNLALPVGPLSTANGTLLPALTTGQITRTDTELCGGRFSFKYQYGVVCGGGGGGLTASGPCGKVRSSCQKWQNPVGNRWAGGASVQFHVRRVYPDLGARFFNPFLL